MKRVCKWIAVLVMALGFILALGTAGASDCGMVTEKEIMARLLVSLVMMCGGAIVSYKIEEKENA